MSGLDRFTFDMPPKLRFGCGVMDELQKSALPGKRIMIVTGGNTIRKNGTLERLVRMAEPKCEFSIIFDHVKANPTLASVMEGAALARENKIDCVIGLGGGSALDTAKGIAAMAVNEGSLWDYTASGSGAGKSFACRPLPMIAIPTTAGTGSEANKTAVITDTERNEKIGIRTDFVHSAYVDPELTLSVPPDHTAEQGFDAFCHCFEAFLSVKANPFSDALAISGMKALYQWLPAAVNRGSDIEARYWVSYGSMIGGMVLFLSSASAAHTLEHMLSGMEPSVSHGGGLAILFLPFHSKLAANVPQRYAQAADALRIGTDGDSDIRKTAALLDALKAWKTSLGLDRLHLRDYGFKSDQIADMVEMTHWVGGGPLTRDRYRLTDDDLAEILENTLKA
ncbi:MAG: iron-containing alcohol dehydrogenase [Anaerolineaceae bacterium]|nr:iron-containing alcohol dehydrogenase [Anaerolineaceae bacterium]